LRSTERERSLRRQALEKEEKKKSKPTIKRANQVSAGFSREKQIETGRR